MPQLTSSRENKSLLVLGAPSLERIFEYLDDLDIATAILPKMSRSFFNYLVGRLGENNSPDVDKAIGVLRLYSVILNRLMLQSNRPSHSLPGLHNLHLTDDKEVTAVARSERLDLFNKLKLLIQHMPKEGQHGASELADQIGKIYSSLYVYRIGTSNYHLLTIILPTFTDSQFHRLLDAALKLVQYRGGYLYRYGLTRIEALASQIPTDLVPAIYDILLDELAYQTEHMVDYYYSWKTTQKAVTSLLQSVRPADIDVYKTRYFNRYRNSQRLRFSGYLFFADAMSSDEFKQAFADLIQHLAAPDARFAVVEVLSQLTTFLTTAQKRNLAQTILNTLSSDEGENEYFFRQDLKQLMPHLSTALTQSDIDRYYQTIISHRIYHDNCNIFMSSIASRLNNVQIQAVLDHVDTQSCEGVINTLDTFAHRLTPDQLNLVPPFFNFVMFPNASFNNIQTLLKRMTPEQLDLAYFHVLKYPLKTRLSSFIPYLSKRQIREGIDTLLNLSATSVREEPHYYFLLHQFAMKAESDQLNLIYTRTMENSDGLHTAMSIIGDTILGATELMMQRLSLEQKTAYFKWLLEDGPLDESVLKSALSLYLTSGCHYQWQPHINAIQTSSHLIQHLIALVNYIASVLFPYFTAPTLSANILLKGYDNAQYETKLNTIVDLTDRINQYLFDYFNHSSIMTEEQCAQFGNNFIELVKQSSIVRNPVRRFFEPSSLSTHSSESLIQHIANPASYKLRHLLIQQFNLTDLQTEQDVRAFLQTILDGACVQNGEMAERNNTP